jgi:hypothetical protein
MEKSIHITDAQYNVGLSIFFVSYALFEVRNPAVESAKMR